MKGTGRRLVNRAAVLLVVLYLAGAVTFRVASLLGFHPSALASLYHSLPGALAGGIVYAAWTGLRARRQGMGALALSAAGGMLMAELLKAPLARYLASLAPSGAAGGAESFGQGVWLLVCDLSAVAILFALFMTATMPFSGRRPAAPGDSAEVPPPGPAGPRNR